MNGQVKGDAMNDASRIIEALREMAFMFGVFLIVNGIAFLSSFVLFYCGQERNWNMIFLFVSVITFGVILCASQVRTAGPRRDQHVRPGPELTRAPQGVSGHGRRAETESRQCTNTKGNTVIPWVHPVVVFDVGAGERGFDRSARYAIEDVWGDRWYFRTEEAVVDFLHVHGMWEVDKAEMAKLRHSRRQKQ
jgi:hypothetical protein